MSKRILVVEDQPDNRQIIRDMLAPTDYEITEVESGEEALALRSINIIAVTSYALSGEEKKAREAGCDDYVPKPFSPRQLLAKIRNTCPKPGIDCCCARVCFWHKADILVALSKVRLRG